MLPPFMFKVALPPAEVASACDVPAARPLPSKYQLCAPLVTSAPVASIKPFFRERLLPVVANSVPETVTPSSVPLLLLYKA